MVRAYTDDHAAQKCLHHVLLTMAQQSRCLYVCILDHETKSHKVQANFSHHSTVMRDFPRYAVNTIG